MAAASASSAAAASRSHDIVFIDERDGPDTDDPDQDDDSESDAFELLPTHSRGRAQRHAARQRLRDDINTWYSILGTAVTFAGIAKHWMRMAYTAPHLETALNDMQPYAVYRATQLALFTQLHASAHDRRRCPRAYAACVQVQRDVLLTLTKLAAARRALAARMRAMYVTAAECNEMGTDQSRIYRYEYGRFKDTSALGASVRTDIEACIALCDEHMGAMQAAAKMREAYRAGVNADAANNAIGAMIDKAAYRKVQRCIVASSGFPVICHEPRDEVAYRWVRAFAELELQHNILPAHAAHTIDARLATLRTMIDRLGRALKLQIAWLRANPGGTIRQLSLHAIRSLIASIAKDASSARDRSQFDIQSARWDALYARYQTTHSRAPTGQPSRNTPIHKQTIASVKVAFVRTDLNHLLTLDLNAFGAFKAHMKQYAVGFSHIDASYNALLSMPQQEQMAAVASLYKEVTAIPPLNTPTLSLNPMLLELIGSTRSSTFAVQDAFQELCRDVDALEVKKLKMHHVMFAVMQSLNAERATHGDSHSPVFESHDIRLTRMRLFKKSAALCRRHLQHDAIELSYRISSDAPILISIHEFREQHRAYTRMIESIELPKQHLSVEESSAWVELKEEWYACIAARNSAVSAYREFKAAT